MIPFNRDTAREHALGKKLRRKDGLAEPIKVFGLTDKGMFLGEIEGGPYITYEWAMANAIFMDGKPLGIEIEGATLQPAQSDG